MQFLTIHFYPEWFIFFFLNYDYLIILFLWLIKKNKIKKKRKKIKNKKRVDRCVKNILLLLLLLVFLISKLITLDEPYKYDQKNKVSLKM